MKQMVPEKGHERLFEDFPRWDVQMVGRFIQQQHIGPLEQQLTEDQPRLFPSAQHGHFFQNVFPRE